jgi:GNAT superfamily N-acetyltransferase
MVATLCRIQSPGQAYFEEAVTLCHEAFPPEERRDMDALLRVLEDPRLHFCAVVEKERLIGLVVFWEFSRFVFIEQLAVLPELRGSGRGTGILQAVRQKGLPLLLEVEVPYDEISRSRSRFYLNNGFIPLPVDYVQPPYRKGDKVPPMELFSDKADWSPILLETCISEFQSTVYPSIQ